MTDVGGVICVLHTWSYLAVGQLLTMQCMGYSLAFDESFPGSPVVSGISCNGDIYRPFA